MSKTSRHVQHRREQTIYWPDTVNEFLEHLLGKLGVSRVSPLPSAHLPGLQFKEVPRTPITHGEITIEGLPFSSHESSLKTRVRLEFNLFNGRQLLLPGFSEVMVLTGTPEDYAKQIFQTFQLHLGEIARERVNWRAIGAKVKNAYVKDELGNLYPANSEVLAHLDPSFPDHEYTKYDPEWVRNAAPGVWVDDTEPTLSSEEHADMLALKTSLAGRFGSKQITAHFEINALNSNGCVLTRLELFDGRSRKKDVVAASKTTKLHDFLDWAHAHPRVAMFVDGDYRNKLDINQRAVLMCMALNIDPQTI